MAAITLTTPPDTNSLVNNPASWNQASLPAAETILRGQPVYITADFRFGLCDGTANNIKSIFYGFATRDAVAGDILTARHSTHFGAKSGHAGGTMIFLGAGAGLLSDTATTGGIEPIAVVHKPDTIIAFGPVRRKPTS